MRFGALPVAEAIGAIAAHNAAGECGQVIVVRKGDAVTEDQAAALTRAGLRSIVVARLDRADVDENAAARRLAEAVAGTGLRVERAFTGRANLFASAPGVPLWRSCPDRSRARGRGELTVGL